MFNSVAARLLGASLSISCLFLSAPAIAAAKTVVVVADPRVLPLARRLQQEIESLGLEVRLVEAQESAREPPSAAAHEVAQILLRPLGGSDVDLTIDEGTSGKTVSYKLISTGGENDLASELVATRTVELLRASLLQLASKRSEPPPRPVTKAETRVPHAFAPSSASLALAAGAAPLFTHPFEYGWQLYLGASWLPMRHFGLTATALPSLVPLQTRDEHGTINLFAQLYRIGGLIGLGREDSLFTFRAVFGAELEILRFEGHATPPFSDAAEVRYGFAPFFGAGVQLRLARDVRLLSELTGALSLPKTTVRSGGTEIGDFGRPLATLAMGLELTWRSIPR